MLAQIGASLTLLIAAVSADNLAGGLASAAFVAYLSGLTTRGCSATQYALFSSLMLLLPKFLAGFSGIVVEFVGYSNFFLITAAIGDVGNALGAGKRRRNIRRVQSALNGKVSLDGIFFDPY